MRLGPFAVVYHAQGFTIIVYPAKCDEWKSIMPASESTSFERSAALKYVVFNAGKAGMFLPTSTVPPQRTQDTESVSTDFLRQVYGLDYGQLLPDKLRGDPDCHNLFLAFPPSRGSVLQMMCTWLRSVNPKCRLFVSDIPGDWTAFADAAESEGGVFIIHSRALQTIRFFAGIQALLHAKSSHVLFWKFEERFEHLKSRTLSRQFVEGYAPFGLSCIFPHGDAVFLTPSFFVSHPNEAYHLLSWYKAQYRRSAAHIQLVVSSGIVTFLRDLAMEKMAERTHLIATEPRCNLASCALTEKDCKARFDVWQLVSDLTRATIAASMPGSVFEYADETIHPCDEQSLVNWFAFWSSTKIHRYRNFRVIGATDSASRRTSIRIDVPPFMRDMSAYPDHTRLPWAAMPTTRSHETDLLEKDGAVDFIRHLEVPNLQNFIVRTFKYPVSYLQSPPDMARHFGDLDMKFSTATSWLKFVREYKGKANTHLCFFYTIKEDWDTWDKDSHRYGTFPPRHAWFAALRPTHPHRFPYEDLELFIWDVATYDMAPAQHDEVYESELLPAQKALIELVRDGGLPLPLRTVWVGDDQPNWLGNTSAIDRTLKMMELMAEQFKTWLPPSSLALQQHGYRKVVQSSREPPAQPDSSAPLYAVFLPPSAPGPYPPPDTRKPEKHLSVNNFYQKVKKAPAGASKMEYQYTATTSWYGIQRGMGRHFEHIQVGGQIRRIYEALRVPRNADT
ncbi:hypothetical protein F5X68DRAFT_205386 [Plectosphaerella plurivora]|uniref:Uncharacterized protein n=1 Tax=Plectosphaerella plurivora TaxID=936078 RepID=A0A9P8VD62_9PEZI|nr:hypothetical protein F5X68DRAFT_205386 [Plectosphaerella plurivora]